jgi:SAM-dependent methyltransferase
MCNNATIKKDFCKTVNENMRTRKKYIHSADLHNMTSPRIIVPLIFKFISPKSIVDFGCGLGTWLRAFKETGVEEIFGLDGKWCKTELLFKNISPKEFKFVDLENPIVLDKTYDFVISLEVAEHLSEKKADVFVQSLVNAGKIILFSAAVPKQGGINHINEQWPAYWKTKFAQYDYYFHDFIRPQIWNNTEIEYWYKQNIFIVAHKDIAFPKELQNLSIQNFDVIHPELFLSKIKSITSGNYGFLFYVSCLIKVCLRLLTRLWK